MTARPQCNEARKRRAVPAGSGRRREQLMQMAMAIPLVALLLVLAGCGRASASASGIGLRVVAAENFWGSIASELGGNLVAVTSIVTDPNADPHEYESNTNDARAFAEAQYVILNGAGYDDWGQKLLDANPASGRKVMDMASLLGKKDGDNPHFWYDPDDIARVAKQITADYKALDPENAATYDSLNAQLLNVELKPYHDEIAIIRAAYSGKSVGATESIFVYLASALGLNLISPPAFMQAVSEGNDPPTATVAAFQQQIAQKQITMLVYNTQTATAVTTNLKQQANAQHIPVVGISETMAPPTTTFEAWQVGQLEAIQRALKGS